MRIMILFIMLFCEISFAKEFTLTGSSTQTGPASFINQRIKDGYSVSCDFTVVPTSVDIKINVGNLSDKLSQVTNVVVTTVAVHGLEITTHAFFAQVEMTPIGGSFTAICVDNL